MMRWNRLLFGGIALVTVLPMVCLVPSRVRQWHYSRFFRQQDIGFYKGCYGEHGIFYFYDYFRLSKGPMPERNRSPLTWGKRKSTLTFVDLDGDGVPEVHIGGYDPKEPGVNYFRFQFDTKTFQGIPFEQVPQKWKECFPEDMPDAS